MCRFLVSPPARLVLTHYVTRDLILEILRERELSVIRRTGDVSKRPSDSKKKPDTPHQSHRENCSHRMRGKYPAGATARISDREYFP